MALRQSAARELGMLPDPKLKDLQRAATFSPNRSASAGTVGRRRVSRRAMLSACAGLAFGGIGYSRYQHHNFKRFQEVRPGVMYRMGQPSQHGLPKIVEAYGIRTIICLRYDKPQMKGGWFFDIGENSGRKEHEYAAKLGTRFVHWRLGGEAHWPWPSPWHLEKFWHLMDDPANHPVLVHCRAGQHRAGTLAAIYRLEYDRWNAQRVLDEMYSFGFGTPQTTQEHNLRTYLPRPLPKREQTAEVLAHFNSAVGAACTLDIELLLWKLRAKRATPGVESALKTYLAEERPFSIGLAQRVIDSPDDPLVGKACELASRCLTEKHAPAEDWTASAAITADFGDHNQRKQLLAILEDEARDMPTTARYRAVVSGVTGRYTPNRVAYLHPLLNDLRQRPEPAAQEYRYADTAVARLTSITGGDFLGVRHGADRAVSDQAIQAAKAWFVEHSNEVDPRPLQPPEKPWWAAD